MSWTGIYRLALRLLPAALCDKHGDAMVLLFERELGRARGRGWLQGAHAAAAGVWDVVSRSGYEQLRAVRDAFAAWRRASSSLIDDPSRSAGAPADLQPGGSPMPQLTSRELLRRHAISFALAFLAFTMSLLGLFASRQVPVLRARGAPAGTIVEALLLAVPFTAAMTIPMAVLVAVLYEFTRLGADGTLAAARREGGRVNRMVALLLGAAVGVAALAYVVTGEVVPRANARLETVLAGKPVARSDRSMTIGELRQAARSVQDDAHAARAVYEVEVQKKLALPAACVVMALAGMAIALRVRRRAPLVVIGASLAVFLAYYLLLVTGEGLADQLAISPVVGMWGANALLFAAALLLLWRNLRPIPSAGDGGAMVREA